MREINFVRAVRACIVYPLSRDALARAGDGSEVYFPTRMVNRPESGGFKCLHETLKGNCTEEEEKSCAVQYE